MSNNDPSSAQGQPKNSITPAAAPAEGRSGADSINIARLRLSQDFEAVATTKKRIMTVPVRKPNRQEFVRTRAGEDWRFPAALFETKDDREVFLVEPSLWPTLAREFQPKVLYLATNRQGIHFLWPVRLPGNYGRLDSWSRSAHDAAELAMRRWVRIAANMDLGAYDVFEAIGDLPDPEWPENTFEELLNIAFKDKVIASLDHAVLRKLRGEL